MSKIKTGAVTTTAKTRNSAPVSTKSDGINRPHTHGETKVIGGTKLKVTVHIPDTVQRKQEKINKIYDILKPKPAISKKAV